MKQSHQKLKKKYQVLNGKKAILQKDEKMIIEMSLERSENLDLAPSVVDETKPLEIDSELLEAAQQEVNILAIEEEEKEKDICSCSRTARNCRQSDGIS